MAKSDADTSVLSSRVIYEWFGLRLIRDDVRLSSGRTFEYTYVRHPGSVIVVPRLTTGEYVLVEQYRHTIRQRSIEFPAGALNAGEDVAAAARRELLEETAIEADDLRTIGQVAQSNGFSDEWMTVFSAEKLVGPPESDTKTADGEMHSVLVMPEAEVMHLISSGAITDGGTLSAFMLFRSVRLS